jgi:hypothetical protein
MVDVLYALQARTASQYRSISESVLVRTHSHLCSESTTCHRYRGQFPKCLGRMKEVNQALLIFINRPAIWYIHAYMCSEEGFVSLYVCPSICWFVVYARNRTCNEKHNREEHNTPTTTHTHQRDLHMHQQQVKAEISSLDIFLTAYGGHVGRNT